MIDEHLRNNHSTSRVLKFRPRGGCALVSRTVGSPAAKLALLIELGNAFAIAQISASILIRRFSRRGMTDGYRKSFKKPRAATAAAQTEAEADAEPGAETRGKVINLALQGGGAHGALGGGVMDKFLEDGRLSIEGVSGTSAGSMDAVVYAYGKIQGNDGAREALHNFWKAIFDVGQRFAIKRRLILRNSTAGQKQNFICATNVRTGQARMFQTSEIRQTSSLLQPVFHRSSRRLKFPTA